jgi:hypothetical protein
VAFVKENERKKQCKRKEESYNNNDLKHWFEETTYLNVVNRS